MSHPYEPGDELDRVDPALDDVAQALEAYAGRTAGEPSSGLSSRILAAIEDEPLPGGRWAWLGSWYGPLRAVAAGGALVIVIVGALAIGALVDRARNDIGSSPSPAPSVTESPTPTPTPSPSPTPSSSVAPSATERPTPAPTLTPLPSPTDGEEFETPEPDETPEPSDSDNSGPGGGGSSGSGSGDDD